MDTAIFDWDGTLAHIDDREFYCINYALETNGLKPVNKEFYIKNYYERAYELGTGPRMVLETASYGSPPNLIEKIYQTYRTAFQDTIDKAELQPGALDLLRALRQHSFKIGIATMRYTHWVVESELERLEVSKLVDQLLTRQDLGFDRPLDSFEETVGQRAKLVSKTLNDFHSKVENAFLVGDSWWDIRSGKTLGMFTVLVRTGFSMYNDFSKEKPDLTVSSLTELCNIFEKTHWTLKKNNHS